MWFRQRVFLFNEVLWFGQHTAAAASRIVNHNNGRNLVLERIKYQMRHQLNDFAWRKVFAGFFVVFFVKFSDQFFKYIPHAQIGQGRQFVAIGILLFFRGKIDIGRYKFFQYTQQDVFIGHMADLFTQLEAVDNFLHVGAETIKIFFEIRQHVQWCIAGGLVEGFQRPFWGVVEDITSKGFDRLVIQFGKCQFFFLKAHFF